MILHWIKNTGFYALGYRAVEVKGWKKIYRH